MGREEKEEGVGGGGKGGGFRVQQREGEIQRFHQIPHLLTSFQDIIKPTS